jgi:hypothetical protein
MKRVRIANSGFVALLGCALGLATQACHGIYFCDESVGCRCECAMCGSTSDAGECADVSVYSPNVGFCRQLRADGPEQCDVVSRADVDAGTQACLDACDWMANRQPGRPFGRCKLVPTAENPWFVSDDPVCRESLMPLDAGR